MAALSPTAQWRLLAETWVSWAPVLGTGVGVGALAGAGQLGLGYGLGLLHYWVPVGPALTGGVWASQLTWVAWFAALAALAGAAGASWLALRQDERLPVGAKIGVAVAGGVGGALVVPLTALPARDADLVGTAGADPVGDVLVATGLGLALGVFAAVAVLTVRLVAVSVTLLVAAVWLLALISAAPSLGPGADLPDVRLAVLDLPALGGARSAVAVLSAPVLALLVCGAVAAAARSRGFPPLMTAVSSAAAPGLLALTYLIGSPGTSDRAAQVSAYAGSLIALAAGLLVALLVGAVRVPSPGLAAEEGGEDAPTGLVPPTSAPPYEEPEGWPAPIEPDEPHGPVESLQRSEPDPPFEPFRAFERAEPPEPDEPPPAASSSSLFPDFRLPPLDLPSPRPAMDAEPDAAAEPEPPDAADRPGEAAPLTATSELPAVPAEKPSKRFRLPRLRRKPTPPPDTAEPEPEPAEPEPEPAEPEAVEPEPAEPGPVEPEVEPTPTAAPEPRPATANLPRPKRRGEVEHVDWISSLADRSEEETPPDRSRRRLRRERDLGSLEDSLPDVPTWAANESPEPDLPSLHRPYISRPDRPDS